MCGLVKEHSCGALNQWKYTHKVYKTKEVLINFEGVGVLTHLDGIVSEPTHYLLIIILQAIDSLAVLTVTLNPGERVVPILPVSHHPLKGKDTIKHRVCCSTNIEWKVIFFAYWNTHRHIHTGY